MRGRMIEPGCLAITVAAHFPENTGRVVRVVEMYMDETDTNQRIWTIEFPRQVLVAHLGTHIHSPLAHHPESYLRRIDTDPTEEQEDDVDASDAADVLGAYDSQAGRATTQGRHQPSGASR